jgi:hypothetical protein
MTKVDVWTTCPFALSIFAFVAGPISTLGPRPFMPSELTVLRDERILIRYYGLDGLGRLAAQLVNVVSRVRTDQRLSFRLDHFPSGAFLQLLNHAFSRIFPLAVGSVCFNQQSACGIFYAKTPIVLSLEPLTMVLGGTPSRLHSSDSPSCPSDLSFTEKTRLQPNEVPIFHHTCSHVILTLRFLRVAKYVLARPSVSQLSVVHPEPYRQRRAEHRPDASLRHHLHRPPS